MGKNSMDEICSFGDSACLHSTAAYNLNSLKDDDRKSVIEDMSVRLCVVILQGFGIAYWCNYEISHHFICQYRIGKCTCFVKKTKNEKECAMNEPVSPFEI